MKDWYERNYRGLMLIAMLLELLGLYGILAVELAGLK